VYELEGRVSSVTMSAPFDGTGVGECLRRALLGASVPAYEGEKVSVQKHFEVGSQKTPTD
jgi:hypothetical protein